MTLSRIEDFLNTFQIISQTGVAHEQTLSAERMCTEKKIFNGIGVGVIFSQSINIFLHVADIYPSCFEIELLIAFFIRLFHRITIQWRIRSVNQKLS